MPDVNPFKGRRINAPAPMRVLHRFTKPGGHWAEIRERTVTTFRAIEYIVFVDGSLLESELFHSGREAEYPKCPGRQNQTIHRWRLDRRRIEVSRQ